MTKRNLVAFTTADDGDARADPEVRDRVSGRLGIGTSWGTVDQVHGTVVVAVSEAGDAGMADGLFSTTPGLPLAVFTADCVGVAVVGVGAVGVAHAGWRGAAAGVVFSLTNHFVEAGVEIQSATIGPHIRSCCFEVGAEVVEQFPKHVSETTWGTPSVDLASVVREQLGDVPTSDLGACTHCGKSAFSHRRDGDGRRMATIVMLGDNL